MFHSLKNTHTHCLYESWDFFFKAWSEDGFIIRLVMLKSHVYHQPVVILLCFLWHKWIITESAWNKPNETNETKWATATRFQISKFSSGNMSSNSKGNLGFDSVFSASWSVCRTSEFSLCWISLFYTTCTIVCRHFELTLISMYLADHCARQTLHTLN